MLFDRTARIGLRIPGRGELRLRFPTDAEWAQANARIGFRQVDAGKLEPCLHCAFVWAELLDRLADEPLSLEHAEVMDAFDRLLVFTPRFHQVSEHRVRIEARVFSGLTVSAEMWRPTPQVLGTFAQTLVPHAELSDVLAIDSREQARWFANLLRGEVSGYAGDVPLFHKVAFADALVGYEQTAAAVSEGSHG